MRSFGDPLFHSTSRRLSGDSVKMTSEVPRVGWPCVLTFVTRDQYSRLVCVPNLQVASLFLWEISGKILIQHLQVEVRASPSSRPPSSSTRTVTILPRESLPDSALPEQETRPKNSREVLTFSAPYEVTVKDHMRLHAITFSKVDRLI